MPINDSFKLPEPKQPDDSNKPTPEEQALIDKFATWVVKRGLTVPAIMAIESTKPLNWIGSQMMLIAEPAAWAVEPFLKAAFSFNHQDYIKFQRLMEKRWSMEQLILAIEKFDAEAKIKEDELKARWKTEKKELKARGQTKHQKFFRKLFGKNKAENKKQSL